LHFHHNGQEGSVYHLVHIIAELLPILNQ